MNSVSRRRFLSGALSGAIATPFIHSSVYASSKQQSSLFKHGVASGDPTADSVIIWTRYSAGEATEVHWEVATDKLFRKVVKRGKAMASKEADYTVKVDVTGLLPSARYFYRFYTDNSVSPVGKTKTLPVGELASLKFAVVSCSNYPFGYFNAYEHIALDDSLSFVLHLGDYIYEYGQDGWGAAEGKALGREHKPAHEAVSLADYRERHAQYKADPASQLMHGAHPLIPTWDDHESTNNPYKEGAQNHQANEGSWTERRNASVQAYFEWMPIREPKQQQERAALWRAFSFGNLATLCTLETRHTGRDKQIDYADHLPGLTSKKDAKAFMQNVVYDASRSMLAEPMQRFFVKTLAEAKQLGQPWRLVGNQIPMAKVHVPPIKDIMAARTSDGFDPVAQEHAQFVKLGELDLPLYLDTWDGYGAAREDLYQACLERDCQDLVVLTGDSHAFWSNQLFSATGRAMGIEIGTSGVTSPGDFEPYGKAKAAELDKRVAEHNKEVLWTDCQHRGYVKVELTHEEGKASYIAMSQVDSNQFYASVLKTLSFKPTKAGIQATLL